MAPGRPAGTIPPMSLRARAYEILHVPRADDRTGRWINLGILALIVANVAVVIVESTETAATPADLPAFYGIFELVSVAVFTAEYLLRLWSGGLDPRWHGLGGRLRLMVTPMAVVDLLAVLPFYLTWLGAGAVDLRVIRILRLFRLFRIFKLGRYSAAMQVVGEAVRARRGELVFALSIVVALLLIASTLMYLVENAHQPQQFASIPAAMWWGIATLTTVGYGDVVPVTGLGRALGAVIALFGIGIFALPAGILAGALNEAAAARRARAQPCPHCGGTGMAPAQERP
jgi:voltage-gated potassium channel